MKLMKLKTSLTYRYSFLCGQNFSRPVAKNNINKFQPSTLDKKVILIMVRWDDNTHRADLRARIAQGKLRINIFNPLHNIMK